MTSRTLIATIFSIALILLIALPRTSVVQAAPSETLVKIDNFSFTPASVTVPVGSSVKWINHDDIPHTVVSDDKAFKSKALDTDEAFTFTFDKPGTYTYFCSIHPKMTGKIVVQ